MPYRRTVIIHRALVNESGDDIHDTLQWLTDRMMVQQRLTLSSQYLSRGALALVNFCSSESKTES